MGQLLFRRISGLGREDHFFADGSFVTLGFSRRILLTLAELQVQLIHQARDGIDQPIDGIALLLHWQQGDLIAIDDQKSGWTDPAAGTAASTSPNWLLLILPLAAAGPEPEGDRDHWDDRHLSHRDRFPDYALGRQHLAEVFHQSLEILFQCHVRHSLSVVSS